MNKLTNHLGVLTCSLNNKLMKSNASILIGNEGKIVIVTAAHCIFDFYTQVTATNITFSNSIVGVLEIDQIFLSENWIKNGELSSDVCFMKIKNIRNIDDLLLDQNLIMQTVNILLHINLCF